jgi:sorbitol-6-phosphate 2-dehydrogenase
MNTADLLYEIIPPARGYCVEKTKRPVVVVSETGETVAQAPGAAVLALDGGDNAADNLLSDLTKSHGGNDCFSCLALRQNDKTFAQLWIDFSLDAAQKRKDKKDTSVLKTDALGDNDSGLCEKGADANARNDVVRNRIALVTGGAQGFGEQIVRALAASGGIVFIADLNLGGAQKLADEINEACSETRAIAAAVNVCDENSVAGLYKTIIEKTGGLDICVSNAGVVKADSILEQSEKDFRFVTDINYTGFFLVAKHAAKLFALQHKSAPSWWTDIIQINSKSGLEGSNKNAAYAGSKFGGLGLVQSFALELIAYNIKVNDICPGNFYDGPLWSDPEKGLFTQYFKTGKVPGAKSVAEVRAFYEAKTPAGRGCTGADVMRALYYIVEQVYETGQALPVSGGQVMLN